MSLPKQSEQYRKKHEGGFIMDKSDAATNFPRR